MVTKQEIDESISNGEIVRYQTMKIEVWSTDLEGVTFRNVEYYNLFHNEIVGDDDVMLDRLHVAFRNGQTMDIRAESVSVVSSELIETSEMQ